MVHKIQTQLSTIWSYRPQLRLIVAGLAIFVVLWAWLAPRPAAAQTGETCQNNICLFAAAAANNSPDSTNSPDINTNDHQGAYYCGTDPRSNIAINIGCNHAFPNPIEDALFAIIRFLSAGVGLVIIASVIVAGIQYTTSQGDPNKAAQAIGRARSALIALLIFIFAYAILNWLVPGGFRP